MAQLRLRLRRFKHDFVTTELTNLERIFNARLHFVSQWQSSFFALLKTNIINILINIGLPRRSSDLSERRLVEVAGVEPASRDLDTRTSTYLVCCDFLILFRTTNKSLQNQSINFNTAYRHHNIRAILNDI